MAGVMERRVHSILLMRVTGSSPGEDNRDRNNNDGVDDRNITCQLWTEQ